MNPHIVAMAVATADEVRELRARLADLEEATADLRRQLVALREARDTPAEGRVPALAAPRAGVPS
jgi:hypothetical protein